MGEEEKGKPKKEGAGSSVILIGALLFLVIALATSLVVVVLTLSKGSSGTKAAVQTAKKEKEKPKPGVLVPLGGDLVVNLADSGGQAYLKVNAVLEVDDPKTVEEVKERAPQIRDLIIGILRLKTVEKISEKEGINHIRSEIVSSINHNLSEGKVINLYFSDFIMQ